MQPEQPYQPQPVSDPVPNPVGEIPPQQPVAPLPSVPPVELPTVQPSAETGAPAVDATPVQPVYASPQPVATPAAPAQMHNQFPQTAFPDQQPAAPMQGAVPGGGYRLPQQKKSKLWIWLLAAGVPVLAAVGVGVYFLLPKGSPEAWCAMQQQIINDVPSTLSSSSSEADRKAAINKVRDLMKKAAATAPGEIKHDAEVYVAYYLKLLDAEEKMIGKSYSDMSLSDFPQASSAETAALKHLTSYTSQTCTSDGNVKK